MKPSIKEEYDHLNSLKKLTFVVSGIVLILFFVVKYDANVSLWVMISAVVCALFDGFLMIGYVKKKEDFTNRMKEREDMHE